MFRFIRRLACPINELRLDWFVNRPLRVLLLIMLVTLACSDGLRASTPPMRSLAMDEISHHLEARSFHSGDEFFQLLFILYHQYPGDLTINQSNLGLLGKEIDSLFPVAKCQSLILKGDEMTISFQDDQDVFIPDTWLQASLLISKDLTLKIIKEDATVKADSVSGEQERTTQPDRLKFLITNGYVRIEFSPLLRIFRRSLREAEGAELHYFINSSDKISRMILVEDHELGVSQLQNYIPEAVDTSYYWLDIVHQDFPKKQDLGIAEDKVSLLGTGIELLPDYGMRVQDGPIHTSKEAWEGFSNLLQLLQDYYRTGVLAEPLIYRRSFGYFFEEEQMSIQMGIHRGQ